MIQLLDSLTSIVILLLLSLDILIVNENLDTKIGLSIKIFLGFNLFFNFAYMFLIYNLQQENKWSNLFQAFTLYTTINQLIMLLQIQNANSFIQYYNMLFIYFLFLKIKKHIQNPKHKILTFFIFFTHFFIYQLVWQGFQNQYFSVSIAFIQLIYICMMQKNKQNINHNLKQTDQIECKNRILISPREQELEQINIMSSNQQNDLQNSKQLVSAVQPNNELQSQNLSSKNLTKLLKSRPKNQGKSYVDTRLQKINEGKKLYEKLWHFLPFGIILLHQRKKIIYYNSKVEGYLECQGQQQVYEKLNSYLNKQQSSLIIYHNHSHIVFDSQKNLNSSASRQNNKFIINHKRQTCFQTEFQEKVQNLYQKRTSKTFIQEKKNDIEDSDQNSSVLNLIFDEYSTLQQSPNNQGFESQQSISKTIAEFKIEFESQKQQKKMLKLTICPIKQEYEDDNEESSIVIILSNITTKLNLTRLQKNFKFELSLISSFSHELRTPLNLSFQLIDQCKSLVSQNVYEHYLDPIRVSNHLLLIQINDILDFSLIQQNQFQLVYQNFVIETLVEEIQELYKQSFEMKSQVLKINVEQGISKSYIKNDLNRIKQILINLINNSQKFTQSQGIVTLSISIQSKQSFIFCVEDSGPGIDEIQLQAIKNYLSKGIISNTEEKYIGLGLKISDKIARYLNSSEQGLNIKSQAGKGTSIKFLVTNLLIKEKSFRINLNSQKGEKQQNRVFIQPLKNDFSFNLIQPQQNNQPNQIIEEEEQQDKRSSIQIQLEESQESQILIIDSNCDYQNLISKLILDKPYDVCSTAEESFQKLKERQVELKSIYKLIILDVDIPELDWRHCLKQIQQILLEKQQLLLAIIALSYKRQNHDIIQGEAEKAGIHHLLPKPIEEQVLSNLIKGSEI